ncbi:MAG: hypothetical protein U0Y68_06210 [Blastocatellia bacterium]
MCWKNASLRRFVKADQMVAAGGNDLNGATSHEGASVEALFVAHLNHYCAKNLMLTRRLGVLQSNSPYRFSRIRNVAAPLPRKKNFEALPLHLL